MDVDSSSGLQHALFTPDISVVLIAITASLCFSLATEVIGWFIVFRHDEYKKSVAEVVEL